MLKRFAQLRAYLLASCQGATAIEYGLIAALVVVVIVASLNAFGGATTNMFNNIQNAVVPHMR